MSERNGLPESWTTAQLADVADIIMGQSPPSAAYNEEGDGLPFFQGKAEFTDMRPVVRKWFQIRGRLRKRTISSYLYVLL